MGQLRRVALVLLLVVGLALPAEAEVATDWNPNSPETLGLEAFFTMQGDSQIPVAWTFASTVTETVDSLTAPMGMVGGGARVTAEVYVAGTETPGAVSTQIYRPSADLANQGPSWINQALATTNLYQSIDEATASDTDYIAYSGNQNPGQYYRMNLASGGWAANRRVVGGFIRIRARRQDATGQLQVGYYDGTSNHIIQSITVTKEWANYSIPFPERNPATGYPWTETQIEDFATTAAIQLKPKNVNKRKLLQVSQAYLSLDYVTEDRVAVGVADVDDQDPGTATTFQLRNPNTGADNWSKANSTDYTVVVRRIGGTGIGSARFLTETPEVSESLLRPDQDVANPISSYVPLLDSRGMVSSLGVRVPGRAQSFWMTRTDAATSADGQPYRLIPVGSVIPNSLGGQTFLAPSTTSYTSARFMLGLGYVVDTAPTTVRPATPAEASGFGDLTVSVRNQTTGALIGSSVTVTVDDFFDFSSFAGHGANTDDLYGLAEYRMASVDLSGVALTSATDYNFNLDAATSGLQTGDLFWASFSIGGGTADGGAAGFGGATYGSGPAGSPGVLVPSAIDDMPLLLSTEVDPPADLTATIVDTDTDELGMDGKGCTIPEEETVDLAWTPSALGAGFGRYEIERTYDTNWAQIRYGNEESADETTDLEIAFADAATYRIRSVRTGDWVPSAWATSSAVTAAPQGGEVVFASNWLEDLAAVNRDAEYEWPQRSNDAVLQLAGRDYQIVLQEQEQRGSGAEGFTFDVSVYTPGQNDPTQTTPAGNEVFAPLADFLRTYAPYIAVKDWNGSLWYGRATVTDENTVYGSDMSARSTAAIRVIETQAEPTSAPIASTGS